MEILIFLIAISVTVATGFLISFIWAVKNGQFEDEYTPAMRMLFENRPHPQPLSKGEGSNNFGPEIISTKSE